jgi:hypothetical protein
MAALNCDVSIVLASGVDCLDSASPIHRDHLAPERFSLVVVSQFQYYFPNSRSSPLARRLESHGVAISTKAGFRRFCHRLLRPGGMVFIIDDFSGRTEAEEEAWNQAWDRHVVRQLTSPEVIGVITDADPRFAREIQRRYDPERGETGLVAMARRIRQRRRRFCREEIESIDATIGDMRERFGAATTGIMAHPAPHTPPNFFTAWAEKTRDFGSHVHCAPLPAHGMNPSWRRIRVGRARRARRDEFVTPPNPGRARSPSAPR